MKTKPKYGIWQNVCFMVRMAWNNAPSVLWLCLAYAGISVGINLAELFIAPMVLERVETMAPLRELLLVIVFFSLLLLALHALRGYVDEITIFGRVSVRCCILRDINEKGCATSYPNVLDPKAKEMLSGAVNACGGNDSPTEHIWDTLTRLLMNLAGFAVYLALLSELDLFLIAVIVATTAVGFFVSRRINEWEYRHNEEKHRYLEELYYIQRKTESVQLAKDIRIFGLAPWLNAVYASSRRALEAFTSRRERVYTWTCVADAVLQFLRNGLAYAYLLRLALSEGLSASAFLLYFAAFSGFSAWVTGLLEGCTTLHKESLRLSLVQEYLHLPEPFRFEGGRPIPESGSWELTMEHVSFRYPGAEQEIFHDLNLTIRPGEKLAVVGLNGAGKTTLVKLLCGFYDPDEGRVLLNGVDIREFNRREYYGLFSAVFQDMSVLDVTVAESVAQSVEQIDRERVQDCLEKAGLSRKVSQLPKGLDTQVGRKIYWDGVEFSGGETQRLMLARALYKDGPILVLDEPTAALDPLAENDIYMKYNEMTAGKTALFISHRLASTRFCDRILFLRDGVIAEEGTHQELLALGGGYAGLFHVQARYYQEGREFDGEDF